MTVSENQSVGTEGTMRFKAQGARQPRPRNAIEETQLRRGKRASDCTCADYTRYFDEPEWMAHVAAAQSSFITGDLTRDVKARGQHGRERQATVDFSDIT